MAAAVDLLVSPPTSPINKLPDELLSNIFELNHISLPDNPISNIFLVCLRWYSVAANHTPILWTRLNIRDYLHSPSPERLQLYLLRSRSRPLIVEIDCRHITGHLKQPMHIETFINMVVGPAGCHMRRWETLLINWYPLYNMPVELENLLPHVLRYPTQRLRHLDVSWSDEYNDIVSILPETPALQTILWNPGPLSFPERIWSTATSIRLKWWDATKERLLPAARDLTTIQLVRFADQWRWERPDEAPTILSFLTTLCISHADADHPLHFTEFPALTRLLLIPPAGEHRAWWKRLFPALYRHCSSVRELVVSHIDKEIHMWQAFFQTVPSLRRLHGRDCLHLLESIRGIDCQHRLHSSIDGEDIILNEHIEEQPTDRYLTREVVDTIVGNPIDFDL